MALGGSFLGQELLCYRKALLESIVNVQPVKAVNHLVASVESLLSTRSVIRKLISHAEDDLHVVVQLPSSFVWYSNLN